MASGGGNKANNGNKGKKRKYEESGEGNGTNKRLPGPSTSLEKRQNKQGQEDTNWMKYIETPEDVPKCACNKGHSFYIKLEPFKVHLAQHKIRLTKKETLDNNWIFNHFDIVKHKDYLKCTKCDDIVEVLFRGPLVNHIKDFHVKRAQQDGESSQGSHKDAETAAKLIQYLFRYYFAKENATRLEKCQKAAKQKTWWANHCDIKNYQKDIIKCNLCEEDEFHKVHVQLNEYTTHMQGCYMKKYKYKLKQTQYKEWFKKYFLFGSNAIWCIICRKPFTLRIYDIFTEHLSKKHKMQRDKGVELRPDATRFLFQFINDSIDNIKV